MHERPALPHRSLALQQSEWLKAARSRILRRADIARRRRILDLGGGWGQVTEELAQRSSGQVVTLDHHEETIASSARPTDRIERIVGTAEQLPFADATFDLVFSQLALLWIKDVSIAIREAHRILEHGGVFAVIEPDYGGMMEYPRIIETKSLWITILERSGADPFIGRRLPSEFRRAGFQVETRFLDFLEPPAMERFELLRTLPLTDEERLHIDQVRETSMRLGDAVTVHLPFWMVLGCRTGF